MCQTRTIQRRPLAKRDYSLTHCSMQFQFWEQWIFFFSSILCCFLFFLFKLYAFMRQCLLLLTYYILLIFVTQFMFYLGKVKLFASTTLENVQHIQTSGFKVSGCIIRFRDEHLRFDSFVSWHNIVRNDNELMSDRCQQCQSWCNFSFWVISFNSS